MNKLPYDALPFSSDREKARFETWLARTPFSLQGDNLYIRPEQIDWPVVLELFWAFRQRRREGWYCSYEDCYGDALRAMRGEAPLDKGTLDEQLNEARELFHMNTRHGVSKIMQLAKLGQSEAMFLAAEFHYRGLYVHRDDELAAEYALKSLEAGFEGVYGFLSLLYSTGNGVEKDEKKAKYYRELASRSSHAYCQKYLGIMLMEKVGGERDVHKGREHLLKAIDAGDLEAVVLLGYYNASRKITEDTDHDMHLLLASAELHDPASMNLLGRLFISTGAFDNSHELIREGMGYVIDAAHSEWPEAIEFLDADYELIKLRDGSTVERGEFYDIIESDASSYWRWYQLVPKDEEENAV